MQGRANITSWLIALCLCLNQCIITYGTTIPDEAEPVQLKTSWTDNQRRLKVLLLTMPASGHTANPLALGEELVRRGHKVTLLMSGNKYQSAARNVGIQFVSSGPATNFEELARSGMWQKDNFISKLLKKFPELRGIMNTEASQLMQFVEDEIKMGNRWDIVIGTDFLMSVLPCIGDMLDAPTIMLGTSCQVYPHTYPPWPWQGSIFQGTSDDMTFFQRVVSAIEGLVSPYFLPFFLYSPVRNLTDKFCPSLSYSELVTGPAVHQPNIVPTVIGFEFPRTMTPLTHYVGPVQSHASEPLSAKLKNWLDGKKDKSVIYISMGSLQSVSKEMADAFVEGIKKTNFNVVWAIRKTDDYELDLDPDRFYLNKWLPQLSVLRHRATGMAIVHGGANGVHESLHSGVPLIVLPGMGEQVANAGRVHNHRLGIYLKRNTLTADQITNSILEIDSGDYRENVHTIQKMFAQAGGVEKAADLVEFYTEVGYDHLIPAYAKYQWSWVQYYNADVYTILLICAVITVYLWFRVFKCVCSRCCGSKKPKTD